MNYFLRAADLGSIIELRIRGALTADTKRKRVVQGRLCLRILKDLGILPADAKVLGIAEGMNTLGDKGFWLVCEAFVEKQAPEQTLPRDEALGHIPLVDGGKEIMRCYVAEGQPCLHCWPSCQFEKDHKYVPNKPHGDLCRCGQPMGADLHWKGEENG